MKQKSLDLSDCYIHASQTDGEINKFNKNIHDTTLKILTKTHCC